MPKIYNYLDYREYLHAVYLEKKAANPAFSYQVFADKAGFRSKSFIKLVIDGKKNLTAESIAALNRVLRLTGKAFSYFEDLVAFNQASSHKVKSMYFEKLVSYNKRSEARLILREQYDLCAKWYHSTIRELVCMYPFGDDYEKLGRMVKPALTARQAKDAVDLLVRLGLITREGERYRQADALITTGNEVQSLAVGAFHLQNMALAAESIDTCPAALRDISCVVLGLSDNGIASVKSEIQEFRKRLLDIAARDSAVNKVYHVAFQMFPTADTVRTGEAGHDA